MSLDDVHVVEASVTWNCPSCNLKNVGKAAFRCYMRVANCVNCRTKVIIDIGPKEKEKANGKIAHSSNLAMRFYVSDGWTKDELDSCIKKGEFTIAHPEDENPYFAISPGSRYDSVKLLKKICWIKRGFEEQNKMTDLQLIDWMNWG